MVDPNPARGMPLQLQRYWLAGKGAAKIRWGVPHDFNRCVRNLRKYFPKNPEGLCNILHQKALGAPPGKGHPGPASITLGLDEASALLAAMPMLGTHLWAGPIAPVARPTQEPQRTRVFEMGSLRHRALPLPLDWREHQAKGHDGAKTVGRILGIMYGPNEAGMEMAYGWGDFLNEEIIPEAGRARYVMEQGVLGASVDPGGRVVVTVNPETGFEHVSEFTIGGATMVPIAAFSGMQLYSLSEDGDWPDDDMDMVMDLIEGDEEECGCAPALIAAVNPNGWKGLPLAMRESVFDNDDAVKRITAWANGGQDVEKMRQAFMYFDPNGSPQDSTSYRLPVGDIINGQLTLIFHAIYAAAALISGAHGGLPNIPEQDKGELRNVISEIYAVMAEEFNDSSVRAPWDRSAAEGVQMSVTYAAEKTEPYGDVEYADPGYRENKKRYPIDTEKHIRAAWAYINQADNAKFYTSEQLAAIKGRIKAAAKKIGIEISEDAMTAGQGYPVAPPSAWFQNPKLTKKSPLTVTDDGRVYGHLAAWNECHRDMAMRECVMAPKSRMGYAPFHLGNVLTADGELLPVGKIVMDTRHADIRLGMTAAADHYDNTGREMAIIRAGEDEHGIWVAGAMVPEATPQMVAKLRRSPLSGDWRRQNGHLELTAALAVNAPAFPVYAMEDGEQWSLVAAGSVWHEEPDVEEVEAPNSYTLVQAMTAAVNERVDEEAQRERAERLRDVLDDEEIYAQRKRAARLANVFAVDPWTKPVKATAPAAPPGGAAPVPPPGGPAPVPAPGAAPAAAPVEGGGVAGPAEMEFINQAAAATRFSVEADPNAETDDIPVEPEGEVPAPEMAPAPPVPPPAA